ncbi:hypothetical protein WG66_004213 [Moniliophthora roreri]|nr:hypothetical protein WG66_004213 [Moniliophthora roreri]
MTFSVEHEDGNLGHNRDTMMKVLRGQQRLGRVVGWIGQRVAGQRKLRPFVDGIHWYPMDFEGIVIHRMSSDTISGFLTGVNYPLQQYDLITREIIQLMFHPFD